MVILGLYRDNMGIMEKKMDTTIMGLFCLWLVRNEGMHPYSSPYITHYNSFHILFPSFIPS